MNVINIDLDDMDKSQLFADEYVLLCLINDGINPELYTWREGLIQSMSNNLWIDKPSDEYVLRSKAKELFENKKSEVNFDEFWDVFPVATQSGRVLRSASKVWGGRPTKDYLVCKKKYLSKVKTIDSHNNIVAIVKARVASKDYEYMNGIEVYINKETWQRDIKYLTGNGRSNIFTSVSKD